MEPNQRRRVIVAIVDQIIVGVDKITMQWANATTMATRHANGALVNLRGEVVEPRRHGRPRKTEAVDTGEGLDLEADDEVDDAQGLHGALVELVTSASGDCTVSAAPDKP